MHGACQVIALGGGLDTTYFDLAVRSTVLYLLCRGLHSKRS